MQLNVAPIRRIPMARSGFTLIELLVVIGIIAILIGILAIGFGALNRAARDTAAAQDVAALKNAVTQFKSEFGFLPPLVDDSNPVNRPPTPSPANPSRVVVWDPTNRDRDTAQTAQTQLRGGQDRFSIYSLGYYLIGVLDAEIDGVEGVGFRRPRADGTFETRGREYQPFFDPGAGGSSAIVQRGDDLEDGEVVLVDRYGTAYRYYRWLPEASENITDLADLNVPAALGDPALNPKLRTATFAIVSAGRNGVFGDDDDIVELGR